MKMICRRGFIAVFFALLALTGGMQPSHSAGSFVPHRFITIRGNVPALVDLGRNPALNNGGMVALYEDLGNQGKRILRSDGESIVIVADTNNGFFERFGQIPSINNKGDVAFSDRKGVFKVTDGGTTISIAEPSPGLPQDDFGAFSPFVSINDDGVVLFKAFRQRQLSNELSVLGSGLYSGTGGPTRRVAFKSTNDGDIGRFNLNNRGRVSWNERFPEFRGQILLGLLIPFGINKIVVADDPEDFSAFPFFEPPSVNDSDVVAFVARMNNGVRGVFKGSADGPNVTVAESSGVYSEFRSPSINLAGTVAFAATLDGGSGQGIFVGPDPVVDRVIGKGDRIKDKTIDSVSLGPESLNDHQQVAFFASFTDGSMGIFRADPDPILPLPPDPLRAMQMTTGSGNGISASQTVPTTSPTGVVELSVRLKFLTTTGKVVLKILGKEVGSIVAPSTLKAEFTTSILPVDVARLVADDVLPARLPVVIDLMGEPGSSVQITQIDFPGVANGNFEKGYLDGWNIRTSRGAAMIVIAFPTSKPY